MGSVPLFYMIHSSTTKLSIVNYLFTILIQLTNRELFFNKNTTVNTVGYRIFQIDLHHSQDPIKAFKILFRFTLYKQ